MKRLAGLSLLCAAPAWARGSHAALPAMDHSFANDPLGMLGLLAVLALVPFAVLMLTSFSKIVVVLSICRSALGTQQAPPTMVLTGLAAVLSATIMSPVCERMYQVGETAYVEVEAGGPILSAAARTVQPLRAFLVQHGNPDERTRFAELGRSLRPPEQARLVSEDDWFVVIPAFVITELKGAFQLGFLIFLPFLVLDMVMANVLLALGMQTLSPSQVSLPFKILLFVAVDGWALLARGLILGYR